MFFVFCCISDLPFCSDRFAFLQRSKHRLEDKDRDLARCGDFCSRARAASGTQAAAAEANLVAWMKKARLLSVLEKES